MPAPARHPGEIGVLTAECWWFRRWPGRAECRFLPHSHRTHPAHLRQVAQTDFEPLIGCWRCRRGAEVPPSRVGWATPSCSPLCHPPARGTWHWVQLPKPLRQTPQMLPRWLLAPARCELCEDGGDGAARPVLQGCMKGPIVPPAVGRPGGGARTAAPAAPCSPALALL